jgi:hypothetical protein
VADGTMLANAAYFARYFEAQACRLLMVLTTANDEDTQEAYVRWVRHYIHLHTKRQSKHSSVK